MIMQDLVSIITPAYNCEKYISSTIESVLEQTYTNWELIIVNDSSSDRTEQIITTYSKKDLRIKLINLEKNCGVVNARNIAISKAKGQFIAFLYSDDCWKKDKLVEQIDFMKINNYALTYTGYDYMDCNGTILSKKITIPLQLNYEQLLKNTAIGCLTVIVDMDKVGNFQMPYLDHGEDLFTWLEIMKRGYNAYGLNKSLALYRISSNSLSRNKYKALKNQWNNYRLYLKMPFIKRSYYFISYILNAAKKHYF